MTPVRGTGRKAERVPSSDMVSAGASDASLSPGDTDTREVKVAVMARLTWIAIWLASGCGSATLRSSDGGAGQEGGAGRGGSRWCTQQSMPAGVAATDYSCVDFDDAEVP